VLQVKWYETAKHWDSFLSHCNCQRIFNYSTDDVFEKITTLNLRYSRKTVFVMDPSTTVPATIPSNVSNASVDVHRPRTNACFFSARLPFLDLPQCLLGV
jgi:hypothetical protein